MKTKLLLLILLLFSSKLFSQNAYYGAQFLAKLEKDDISKITKQENFFNTLSEYQKNQLTNLELFLEKPFDTSLTYIDYQTIETVLRNWNNFNNGEKEQESMPVALLSFVPDLISGVSSFDNAQLDTLLLGLTKYIAEEFKKAQMISYMQLFEKTLGKYGDLQLLFPETMEKLKFSDPTKFPDIGEDLKIVFYEDLNNMPQNLIHHIETYNEDQNNYYLFNKSNNDKIKKSKEYEYFVLISEISDLIIKDNHPVDIFNYLNNKYYVDTSSNKRGKTFHGINLLQSNFRVKDNNDTTFSRAWITLEDAKKLNTPKEEIYFIALLYMEDRDYFNSQFDTLKLKDKSNVTITTLQNDIKTYSKFIQKKIYPFLNTITQIDNFLKSKKGKIEKEDFLVYMNLIVDCIKEFETNEEFNKYIRVVDNTLKIYNSIYLKSYDNVPFYLSNIISELLKNIDEIEPDDIDRYFALIDKYGSFMTSVVNAESSDDAKKVIKQYVAPSSSFIEKRKNTFTVSVTSFPGYYISEEQFTDTIKLENTNWNFNSGLTLPIGIDFSFKLHKSINTSSSLNVFFQIIDLGAMLNFTLINSQAKLPDEVKLEHIFSPGISLNYGFANSPVTIGFGWQYAPKLREITDNGNKLYPNTNRIYLRLAWDIPLINVYKTNRRENRKVKFSI